ncbi:BTAD domain-containing putative transcriptional regulator [Cupriavidus basilensis]
MAARFGARPRCRPVPVRACGCGQGIEARRPGAEEESLTHAADLYRGDLLANCYDEWIHAERERLREQCIAALARLGQLSEDRRDYAKALKYTQQLQRLDPCREPTCMALMRLHALNHDHASAIRVYQSCVETLARELGVLPGEPMREAYARLAGQAASMQRQRPRDAMLPMIGRHGEWRRLLEVWQRTQQGDKQFVLILGEAGIGKSRLAEELLVHLSEQGITVAHSRAYAAEGQLAFAPVTGWLRSAALSGAIGKLDRLWLTEVTRLLPRTPHAAIRIVPAVAAYRVLATPAVLRSAGASGCLHKAGRCCCCSTTSNGATARRLNGCAS